MSNRKEVDKLRESNYTIEIGTIEEGLIYDMFIGQRKLFIKENATYELKFADDIDPHRINPDLPPNTLLLILPLGSKSEIFSKTFLTAARLFNCKHFTITLDINKAMSIALELAKELAELDQEISDYLRAENEAIFQFQERYSKGINHIMPSVINIKTRCKTIFQKVDHILQAQMEIIRLFFPEFKIRKDYYEGFLKFVENKYEDKNQLPEFIRSILLFIIEMRDIRNCLEHNHTEIKIINFDLNLNSDIATPTIEMFYNTSKLAKTGLSSYLPFVKNTLVEIIENMSAFLCSSVFKSESMAMNNIAVIPEEHRKNKFIKFAYRTNLGDTLFYHQ